MNTQHGTNIQDYLTSQQGGDRRTKAKLKQRVKKD